MDYANTGNTNDSGDNDESRRTVDGETDESVINAPSARADEAIAHGSGGGHVTSPRPKPPDDFPPLSHSVASTVAAIEGQGDSSVRKQSYISVGGGVGIDHESFNKEYGDNEDADDGNNDAADDEAMDSPPSPPTMREGDYGDPSANRTEERSDSGEEEQRGNNGPLSMPPPPSHAGSTVGDEAPMAQEDAFGPPFFSPVASSSMGWEDDDLLGAVDDEAALAEDEGSGAMAVSGSSEGFDGNSAEKEKGEEGENGEPSRAESEVHAIDDLGTEGNPSDGGSTTEEAGALADQSDPPRPGAYHGEGSTSKDKTITDSLRQVADDRFEQRLKNKMTGDHDSDDSFVSASDSADELGMIKSEDTGGGDASRPGAYPVSSSGQSPRKPTKFDEILAGGGRAATSAANADGSGGESPDASQPGAFQASNTGATGRKATKFDDILSGNKNRRETEARVEENAEPPEDSSSHQHHSTHTVPRDASSVDVDYANDTSSRLFGSNRAVRVSASASQGKSLPSVVRVEDSSERPSVLLVEQEEKGKCSKYRKGLINFAAVLVGFLIGLGVGLGVGYGTRDNKTDSSENPLPINPIPAPPPAPTSISPQETVWDIIMNLTYLCGAGTNGTLSAGQKSDLEYALLQYGNEINPEVNFSAANVVSFVQSKCCDEGNSTNTTCLEPPTPSPTPSPSPGESSLEFDITGSCSQCPDEPLPPEDSINARTRTLRRKLQVGVNRSLFVDIVQENYTDTLGTVSFAEVVEQTRINCTKGSNECDEDGACCGIDGCNCTTVSPSLCETNDCDLPAPEASDCDQFDVCFQSAMPTLSPTKFQRPSSTPSKGNGITPSDSPSLKPSNSSSPSGDPFAVETRNPSSLPSSSVSPHHRNVSSVIPSLTPSHHPSEMPSAPLSSVPTSSPSGGPSAIRIHVPSADPSGGPTELPTLHFSPEPSDQPSTSALPSRSPSDQPSNSIAPSPVPSDLPSKSGAPSTMPSESPSGSGIPSSAPSDTPSLSALPSIAPSDLPTTSAIPSFNPSSLPSDKPSAVPSHSPSSHPSSSPSAVPSISSSPSFSPSDAPTDAPSSLPSDAPTAVPSASPSSQPTTRAPTATSAIGFYFWYDFNGNGSREPDEPLIHERDMSFAVNLINCDSNETVGVWNNDDGKYEFFSLDPGRYQFVFFPPSGTEFYGYTRANQGDIIHFFVDRGDSLSGWTDCTTLDPGEEDFSWGIGFVRRTSFEPSVRPSLVPTNS